MHPMLPDDFFYKFKRIGDTDGGHMCAIVSGADDGDVEYRFSNGNPLKSMDNIVMNRSEARRLATDILFLTETKERRKWIEDINKANKESRGADQTHVMTHWVTFDPEHPPISGWYLVCYYDIVDERNEMAFAYYNAASIHGPEWMIHWMGEIREGTVLMYTSDDAIVMALTGGNKDER